jgi:hypothetical protein
MLGPDFFRIVTGSPPHVVGYMNRKSAPLNEFTPGKTLSVT